MYRLFYLYLISNYISILFLFYLYFISTYFPLLLDVLAGLAALGWLPAVLCWAVGCI